MDNTSKPFHLRLWDVLASLQLTLISLAVLMALVVLCTLAQTQMGVFSAVQTYMRSFFVWWHIPALPFRIPIFPGGALVGLVLMLNLTAALIKRFDFSWRKSGLWITHAGLILLIAGEFSTGAFQVETRMTLEEGQTVNYTESPRDVELATYMRPRRNYLPYSVTLKQFHHDVYPGTDTPRNFSSLVHLSNPAKGEERDVLIAMNQPLRYEGNTFYQYQMDEQYSVLQVVRNPGWRLPYISCALITFGLLIHFGLTLGRSLKQRRAA